MYRRRTKYGNKKVVYEDIKFDSIVEKDRYIYLRKQQEIANIYNLELQKKYLIQDKFIYRGKTIRAIHYIADFSYTDANGGLVIEDVKGIETAEFKLKAKLFKYKYPDILFYAVTKQGTKWVLK